MDDASRGSLKELLIYFLKLGTFGFGGPIALVGRMHRDLVESKKWFTQEQYSEGLALSQLAPGPLAAQLAIYLGWAKGGIPGATLAGIAFCLPSFLIVLVLSAVYIEYGGLSWLQGMFYGVGSAVIAVIGIGAYRLSLKTVGRDKLLWTIAGISALITVVTESELLWVFLSSGILVMLVRARPQFPRSMSVLVFSPFLISGIDGPADAGVLSQIFWFFAKAGSFVFGSGLAIVPFLHSGVVLEHHWLTERQFLDAVAVAMVTPGPVVITVAFIGYLVAGVTGATLGALGVFLPCYLLTIFPAPYFNRFSKNPSIKAFVDGVTTAAVGAIGGAAIVLGRRALIDIWSVGLCVGALFLLLKVKRIPEPLVILAAGLIGLLIKKGI